MKKKYQIFISSTYVDLKRERKIVADIITKSGHIPVGMELFPSAEISQWVMIQELINTSDYYILLIAKRYGSIATVFEGEENKRISWTHKEYEYASKQKIPILTFFLDSSEIPLEFYNEDKTQELKNKLSKFIKMVKNNGKLHEYWKTPEDLGAKVHNALNSSYTRTERPGWVRSNHREIKEYNSEIEIQEKILYYKFLYLSEDNPDIKPFYTRITKNGQHKIDVYDEYLTIRIVRFNHLIKNYNSYDRTSGSAVEVSSLLPYIFSLPDSDRKARNNPQIVQPIILGPSDTFSTVSTYYNGFQGNNKDLGTKADKDTEIMRLIVDFTSIKDFEKHIIPAPKIYYTYFQPGQKNKMIEIFVGNPKILTQGIYLAERENMKYGESLRIEFGTEQDTNDN